MTSSIPSETLGLAPDVSNAMHEAAVRRSQSHQRVLEALRKAGATDDTIRCVIPHRG